MARLQILYRPPPSKIEKIPSKNSKNFLKKIRSCACAKLIDRGASMAHPLTRGTYARSRPTATFHRTEIITRYHRVSGVTQLSIFPLRLPVAFVTLSSTATSPPPGSLSFSWLVFATSASILYLYVSTKSSSGETAA
jgi:hypothetical protein